MWIYEGILIAAFVGLTESDLYKKGAAAVLSPGSVSNPITSVVWKHGRDIAVEWAGEDITEYRDFRGRSELNINTGELRISKLSLKDSGSYTAEINSRIMKTTEVTVLTAVPKPTISTHCNPEETLCTLTCEASITKDMGPVLCFWLKGDEQIPESPKWLHMSKDHPELVGKLISCQLENPISRERSDDIISPFTNENSGGVDAAVTGSIVSIVLIVVLTGFVCWHKHRRENAEKSWSEYFDPSRCLNPGRELQRKSGLMTDDTTAEMSAVPLKQQPQQEDKLWTRKFSLL